MDLAQFIFKTAIFMLFYLPDIADASRTNFDVKKFELCNYTQGEMKFYGNITKENGEQYLTYNLTMPLPWDDNLGVTWLIESKTVGNVYVELFTIREKNLCKAINSYLGEFWYDIERAVPYPPGVCPIPAGRFHGHRVLLDFRKISLQTFPFGKLRFTIKLINNRNKHVKMLCLLLEVENSLS